MTVVGIGVIPIKPDFGNFHRDVQREGSKAADGLTSHFKGAFKSIAALGGGVLLGAGLVSGLKSAFAEAAEAQKVGRLTEQVIKTTGGAAKITAKQIGDLSTAISNKAGIDDEAIQSGANLVATFTKVRNEAGKGNDIFSQTVQVATDMSVALGQDMKSSSLQLGKALNDPIKGITALSRAGVSFTADQKAQIKVLQESGDILGAQKIILKEVGTEFGGAAAAAASPVDKLKVVWGNLLETLGTRALPIVGKVADWLGKMLPVALDKAGAAFGWLGDKLAPVGRFLANAADMGKRLFDMFRSGEGDAQGFAEILDNIFGNTGNLVGPFRELYLAVGKVFNFLKDSAVPALVTLWKNFTPIGLIVSHLEGVKTGIGVVKDAISSFVAGFQGKGGPGSILTDLGEAARGAMRVFNDAVLPAFRQVVGFIGDHLKPILIGLGIVFAVLTGPVFILVAAFVFAYQKFAWFRDGVAVAMGVIKAVITTAIDVIVVVFKGIVWTIQNVVMPIFNRLKGLLVDFVFPLIAAVIKDVIVPAFNDIWKTVKTVWSIVRPIFETIIGFIQNKFAPVWKAISAGAALAFNALPGLIRGALRLVGGIVSGFLSGVGSIASALGLGDIAKVLKDGANSAKNWGQGSASNNTGQGQGGISVQGGTRRAMGGTIPGSGRGDHVPILAEPGEFMIRRDSVNKYGRGLMEMINAGRFAKGGLIPGIPDIDLDGIVRKGRQLGASALDSVWPKMNASTGKAFSLGFPGGDVPAGGANYLRDAVIGLIRGSTSTSGAGGGGGGMSGSVADWIRQAMGLTGVPESWFALLMARVKLESGGNPRAINLWDSNAVAGHPSKGLMQTIDSTFNAYKLPGHGDIWNPVDNASAAIRYILARYGSIFNVNPHTGYALGGLVAHQRPFDQGGVLEPGWNAVNNTTGGREGVYPQRSGPLIGSVHLHDREAVDEFWRRTLFETTAHGL